MTRFDLSAAQAVEAAQKRFVASAVIRSLDLCDAPRTAKSIAPAVRVLIRVPIPLTSCLALLTLPKKQEASVWAASGTGRAA